MFIREIKNLDPEIIKMVSPPPQYKDVTHPSKNITFYPGDNINE